MAFSDQIPTTRSPKTLSTNQWVELLRAETDRLELTGVLGAVLTIGVDDDERTLRQIMNLLGRYLTSPSTVSQTDHETLSVLLLPVFDFVSLHTQVHEISEMLQSAGLSASISFALRRTDEPLLDTWARAEAERDRVAFRSIRRGPHLNLRNT